MAKKKLAPKKDESTVAESQRTLYHEVNGEKRIFFDYEKGNYFRVIHVDGAVGGPTPRGDGIQMGLYSERVPIPTREEFPFKDDGTLGDRIDVQARPGIYREMEIEAILSIDTARKLRDWLNKNIAFIENLRAKGTPNVQ